MSLYFVHHSFLSYSLRLFVRLLVHLYNFIAQIHQDLSIICSVKMLNGEPITSFYWMILCTRYVLRLIHAHLFISFLVEVFFYSQLLLLMLRERFFVCSADYNPVFLRYSFLNSSMRVALDEINF